MIALIDADTLPIAATFAAEGYPDDMIDLMERVDREIHEHARFGDGFILCWSADREDNFRRLAYPAYKQSRDARPMPTMLKPLRTWMMDFYPGIIVPTWEADDVLGVAVHEYFGPENCYMVSIDKDLQTVPGWLYNPKKDLWPKLITTQHAERFLATQLLTGDASDNYPGLPRIGPVKAAKMLTDKHPLTGAKLVYQEYVKQGKIDEGHWEAMLACAKIRTEGEIPDLELDGVLSGYLL